MSISIAIINHILNKAKPKEKKSETKKGKQTEQFNKIDLSVRPHQINKEVFIPTGLSKQPFKQIDLGYV